MKEAMAFTEVLRNFRLLSKEKKLEVFHKLKDMLWEEV